MLHLLMKVPVEPEIMQRFASGDDVIFLQSSSWCCMQGHKMEMQLQAVLQKNCRIHVLHADLKTYGIEVDKLLVDVAVIDFHGFVELSEKNPLIFTWR